MPATYTFDVFSSLDGYGSATGDWAGYWGKQGPELLDHRLGLYAADQRVVLGANTYREFAQMFAENRDADLGDPWGDPDATAAGGRRLDDAGGAARLAQRDLGAG